MKIAILTITNKGRAIGGKISKELPGSEIVELDQGIKKTFENIWHQYDGFICIMAVGIVIRCIGNLFHSKYSDPCVVAMDEQGLNVVSLLSGHIGGGNMLAGRIAAICGANAVVSTGSDVSGHTSIDLWAIDNNLTTINRDLLAEVSARLLNSGFLNIYQSRSYVLKFPSDFKSTKHQEDADIIISLKNNLKKNALHLMPRIHYIGFGCRRGANVEEFQQALNDLEKNQCLNLHSVAGLASIDLKENEQGLLAIAARYKWPIRFFDKERINAVMTGNKSAKIYEKIGVHGVCEPSALLAAAGRKTSGRLITGKIKWKRITAAIAVRES